MNDPAFSALAKQLADRFYEKSAKLSTANKQLKDARIRITALVAQQQAAQGSCDNAAKRLEIIARERDGEIAAFAEVLASQFRVIHDLLKGNIEQ